MMTRTERLSAALGVALDLFLVTHFIFFDEKWSYLAAGIFIYNAWIGLGDAITGIRYDRK